MILRLLVGFNLLLLAGWLAVALSSEINGRLDAAEWWRAAKANEFEWRACETKRDILLRQIKKEGLWRRLGLPGQPWLR